MIDAHTLWSNNPTLFIEKYILEELEELIKQIARVYNSKDQVLTWVKNYLFKEEEEEIITHLDDILDFKGEKISGALDFLETIKSLENISIKVDECIEKVLEFNTLILPELKERVKILEEELNEYNHQLRILKLEYDEAKVEWSDNFEKYSGFSDAIFLLGEMEEPHKSSSEILENSETYIELKKNKEEYSKIFYTLKDVTIPKIKKQIEYNESYIKKLSKHIEIIENYLT